MKLIDAFIFYNEEKMLDYRLNYYKDIVDYFIIVEATKTFSGLDKPLYFNRIKDKYSHLNIIHYIVDEFPANMTAWDREHYQRECIHKALLKVPKLRNDDWVHIADVDEISNRDKLDTVLTDSRYNHPDRVGYTLLFDNYYYNLTSKLDQPCLATKLIRYGELKNKVIKDVRFSTSYPLLYEFGWHLSYFFSPEGIKNKIKSFSHQEYNKDEFTSKDHIEHCIKNGKSLFYLDPERKEKIYHIPLELNTNLPEGYETLYYTENRLVSVDKLCDNKKLKLALIFSGQPRFYNSKSYNSIKEKILEVYDCDIFCHFWWDGKGEGEYVPSVWNKLDPIKMDEKTEENLKDMYNPVSIQYDFPIEHEPIDFNRYKPHQPTSGYNIRSMYTSMKRAHKLYKENKQKDYDFIVRLRYDIFIENFPDLNIYGSNDLILSNSRDNRTDVIANEIWICKPCISEYLFNILDYSTEYNNNGVIWNDEELFNAHVRDKLNYTFSSSITTHIPYKYNNNPHF